MKTIIALCLFLAANLAQAGNLHRYSTKTGQQIRADAFCPIIQPLRQASLNVALTQNISKTNIQDGSASFQELKVCTVTGQVNVYDIPSDLACVTTESNPIVCEFIDSSGQKSRTAVDAVIALEKGKKEFSIYLTTIQGFNRQFDTVSAKVTDLTLKNITLTAYNRGLASSDDGSVQESIAANVTFEDQTRP